jgi:hypothetical protein
VALLGQDRDSVFSGYPAMTWAMAHGKAMRQIDGGCVPCDESAVFLFLPLLVLGALYRRRVVLHWYALSCAVSREPPAFSDVSIPARQLELWTGFPRLLAGQLPMERTREMRL